MVIFKNLTDLSIIDEYTLEQYGVKLVLNKNSMTDIILPQEAIFQSLWKNGDSINICYRIQDMYVVITKIISGELTYTKVYATIRDEFPKDRFHQW